VGICNIDNDEDVDYLLSSDGADGASSSLDADVVDPISTRGREAELIKNRLCRHP